MIKFLPILLFPLYSNAQWVIGFAGAEMHFGNSHATKNPHWRVEGGKLIQDNTGEYGGEYSFCRLDFGSHRDSIRCDFDWYVNNAIGISDGYDVEFIEWKSDSVYTVLNDTVPYIGCTFGNKINFTSDLKWHHYTVTIPPGSDQSLRFRYDCDWYESNSYNHHATKGWVMQNFKFQLIATDSMSINILAIDSVPNRPKPAFVDTFTEKIYLGAEGLIVQPEQPYEVLNQLGQRVEFDKPGLYFIRTEKQTIKIIK